MKAMIITKKAAVGADMLSRNWSEIDYRLNIYHLICSSLNLDDSNSVYVELSDIYQLLLHYFKNVLQHLKKNQFKVKLLNRLDYSYFKYFLFEEQV